MRFVLTAGFDRALHAVALLDGLVRAGHEIGAVIIVTPFDAARARALVRQRGIGFLATAARRVLGGGSGAAETDEMAAWLKAHAIVERSLSAACRKHGIARHVVASLNGDDAIAALRAARAQRVIYAGGGILKARFLREAGGPVLNAHSGPLPEIRGMNACEWSLLLGVRPAVTIHLIDEGIDTGAVLEEIPLPVLPGDTIARLRSRCAVLGVEGMLRAAAAPIPVGEPVPPRHRQCFLLAPALHEILVAKLAARARA